MKQKDIFWEAEGMLGGTCIRYCNLPQDASVLMELLAA
jgi:hypothetical protein